MYDDDYYDDVLGTYDDDIDYDDDDNDDDDGDV
jgi:hypothetical protein